jgi:hypothetical protein
VEFSHQRVTKFAVGIGLAGAVFVLTRWGPKDSLGFLTGAGLSLLSYQSWLRLAGSLGESGTAPPAGSALFLVLRYFLIAALIYVIVRGLGTSPAPLIVGLLVSFAAVVLALLSEFVVPSAKN